MPIEIVIFTAVSLLLGAGGCVGGLLLGHANGRRAAIEVLAGVESKFEGLRSGMANVADECFKFMERAQVAQSRVISERNNIERRLAAKESSNGGGPMTLEQYRSHLHSGGAAIPEMETAISSGQIDVPL